MSNQHPSASWKPGETGNPKGRQVRGQPWKEIIREIGDEDTPEQWKHLGRTYKEAVIRTAYHKILEGRVEYLDWFMRYSEPNSTEINIQLTDWTNFRNLGIDPRILIDRAKDIINFLKAEQIEGQYRELIEGPSAGRSDNDSGAPELVDGTTGREDALDTPPKTETPDREPGI